MPSSTEKFPIGFVPIESEYPRSRQIENQRAPPTTPAGIGRCRPPVRLRHLITSTKPIGRGNSATHSASANTIRRAPPPVPKSTAGPWALDQDHEEQKPVKTSLCGFCTEKTAGPKAIKLRQKRRQKLHCSSRDRHRTDACSSGKKATDRKSYDRTRMRPATRGFISTGQDRFDDFSHIDDFTLAIASYQGRERKRLEPPSALQKSGAEAPPPETEWKAP